MIDYKIIENAITALQGGGKKDKFTNYASYDAFTTGPSNDASYSSAVWVSLMFTFAISIFCIYLSWTCNTAAKIDTPLKVLYAFFAWFFGIFYLIFYFFNNYLGKQCGMR